MNIVHLANHCHLGHGNVHAAVDLACIQASHNETVFYASDAGELRDCLLASGVAHVSLPQRSAKPQVLAAALAQLVGLIRREKIEIVHAHMMAGAVLGYLATRLTRTWLVTTVHNSFDGHSKLMRLGDRIIAVSEAERQTLLARGFPARKLVAVLNGPLGSARAAWLDRGSPAPLPRPSITTVCGLHARKGVDIVIEAFRQIAPDFPAALNIVGDGPDRGALEQAARATGFGDRIRFHGSLRDPGIVLRNTDIFLLASHAEPLGLVNLEARAAGCAIIASAVGGIPEALDAGHAGILVPAGSAEGFSVALRHLLTDAACLAVMKKQALEGLDRFSVERLFRDHRAVYASLGRRKTLCAVHK